MLLLLTGDFIMYSNALSPASKFIIDPTSKNIYF